MKLLPVKDGTHNSADANDDFILNSASTVILSQLTITVHENEINALVNK